MKKLILAGVLAAIATPAFAQLSINIGPETREYIVREGRSSVAYDGEVVVGATLPETVEVYELEGQPTYRYTVVNSQRVIVDPDSRRVIQIID